MELHGGRAGRRDEEHGLRSEQRNPWHLKAKKSAVPPAVGWLKQNHRVGTRYDKLATSFDWSDSPAKNGDYLSLEKVQRTNSLDCRCYVYISIESVIVSKTIQMV